MAQTAREIFIVGLRDAHAMETQARELMGASVGAA
jgi:ferritin-like metal-binding protein YciE